MIDSHERHPPSAERLLALKDRHTMFVPIALLLLLVGAGLGSVLALRRPISLVAADESTVELRRHDRRSARWSSVGVGCGLAGGLIISLWDSLGRGLLMAAPLFGLVVLITVCIGEMTAQTPVTSQRKASLHTRQVRNYVPRLLTAAVVVATVILTISMIGAALAGSPDDMGRAGRWLTVVCANGVTGSQGPWPGWFYAAPLLAMTGLGVVAAAAALTDIVRRTRLDDLDSRHVDDSGTSTNADDELRRRSARTVVAAYGVAVAIPLSGVATFGVIALAGTECLPIAGRVVQYGWAIVIPLATILLGWSGTTLAANTVSVVLGRKPVR